MSITDHLCAPNQYLPPAVANKIFNEILSAIGGYALLQEALGLRPSFLCRGMEGELILSFKNCDWANKVKITPEGIDSYCMTFYRFSFKAGDSLSETLRERGCQHVETIQDIDRDQLQHSFEEFTELSLTPKLERNGNYCFTDVSDEEIN
jgi:hypothetical protein